MSFDEDWKYSLSKDDSFKFECSSCGECCRGEMLIQLSLNDLSLLMAYMQFQNTGELFNKGIIGEFKLQKGGFRPYLIFDDSPFKSCPFLLNTLDDDGRFWGYCKLHPQYKPLVCSLAPLGREIEGNREEWFFCEPIQGCPGCHSSYTHSVSETIEDKKEELDVERVYFSIMDRLQELSAPFSIYQQFHSNLTRDESIYDYLQLWKEFEL